jgi:hypothetical protein
MVLIPDMLGELRPADDLARIACQVGQESELFRRELDGGTTARDALGGKVDLEVGQAIVRIVHLLAATAQERPDPRHQLLELEWLGKIVVSSAVEPRDPVLRPSARGEHEDPYRRALLAQRPAHGQPVHPWNVEVEDDRVVGADARLIERRLTVRDDVDDICMLAQPARDGAGEIDVVFDQQEAHGAKLGRAGKPRKLAAVPPLARPPPGRIFRA